MLNNNLDLDSEIKKFIKRVKQPFLKYQNTERSKYDYSLKKLNYFYFVSNYISCQGLKSIGDDKILFTIYNKAVLDLLGIYHCLYNGLEIQAQNLLRSIFENYLNCRIIFEIDNETEIKRRIKLFREFKYFKRWKHIEDSMENKLENTLSDNKINDTKTDYERIKLNYDYKRRECHWSYSIYENNSLNNYELCAKFDLVEEYCRLYTTLSISTHNSPFLEDYYEKEGKTINAPKFTESSVSLSVMTIYYCVEILVIILNFLKPKNYQIYNKFLLKFKKDFIDESTILLNRNVSKKSE